ncbi:hypothetical protein CRG98_044914, partial [Punica granatum]
NPSSASSSTPASVTEHASVCHRARPCPSPTLVISAQYPSPALVTRHQHLSSSMPVPVIGARHQHPSPIALALVTEHTSARHRARQRSSPTLVTCHQHPSPYTRAPVTVARHQRHQHPSPASPAPVTVPANTCHRARR